MKGTVRNYLKLAWRLYRNYRTPKLAKILLWVAVVYVIFPFDLIPDFIPILGQIDDFVVLVACFLIAIWMIPVWLYDEEYYAVFGKPHHR